MYQLDKDTFPEILESPEGAFLPKESCGDQSPCRNITLDTTVVRKYSFYVYATAIGIGNYNYSTLVTVNVAPKSLSL